MANASLPSDSPRSFVQEGEVSSRETGGAASLPLFSPLLFRQVCLLAGIFGMLACRYPAHGLLACFLLALLTLSFTEYRRITLFLTAFGLGYAFAFSTAVAPLDIQKSPDWLRASITPAGKESDARFTAGVALTGTVLENTALAGNRVRLLLAEVSAVGEAEPLPGNLVLVWQNPPPDLAVAGPGQRLATTVRLREIRGFANPGVWETETYWRDKGAYFRAWVTGDGSRNGKNSPYVLSGEAPFYSRSRTALSNAVIAVLGEANPETLPLSQAAAIIPALLFGDRSHCTPETLDLVARATLTHSLALSGMHLAFVASIGYCAAYLLQMLFPVLFLRMPRQKVGLLCAILPCLCYLWIGGAQPSLIRAALMLFFWGLLFVIRRPKVLVDGLLWAVALILLFSPATLFDLRLLLSAVSVAGLGLAAPLLGAVFRRSQRHSGGRLRNGCRRFFWAIANITAFTIAAQTAVLPLIIDAFPGTGLWFPLNLIWLPVLGVWVMPAAFAGLFLTAIGGTSIAGVFFFLAQVPCQGLLFLLEAMDAAGILAAPVALRPAFVTAAGYWLLLVLIPVVVSARGFTRRTIVSFCLGLVLAATPTVLPLLDATRDTVRLQLLDVGQGQAVVLSWKIQGERGRILVDGGGFASPFFDVGRQIVTPSLTNNAAPRLDMIVNSHPDTDHLQGLLFPLSGFTVGSFISGPGVFGPDAAVAPTRAAAQRDTILQRRNIPVKIWQAGDVIPLAADLVLEVLHPGADAHRFSTNDNALVFRIVWRGKPLTLICGDVERKGLTDLLRKGFSLNADVLVLPHHGSAGSHAPKFYDAVSPTLALAACGYANPWHFPAEKVRAALAERSIPLLATADKGQISVTWDASGAMRTTVARD